MKKILIVSSDRPWRKSLASYLKNQNDLEIIFCSDRTNAITEISSNNFNAIIIDDTLTVNDISIIFKYINTNEMKKTHIYFLSKEFEKFSEILESIQFPNIKMIQMPIAPDLLAEKIFHVLFTVVSDKHFDKELNLNIDFLKIFIDSTKYILEAFCNAQKVQHQKPVLYNNYDYRYAIMGSIQLESTFFEGNFFVCFNKETYLAIIKNVLLQEDQNIDETNQDFAGEIVNMIYGQAKSILNESGYKFEKIFPKYEVGPGPFQKGHHIVKVPISMNYGVLDVCIEVKKVQAKPTP